MTNEPLSERAQLILFGMILTFILLFIALLIVAGVLFGAGNPPPSPSPS